MGTEVENEAENPVDTTLLRLSPQGERTFLAHRSVCMAEEIAFWKNEAKRNNDSADLWKRHVQGCNRVNAITWVCTLVITIAVVALCAVIAMRVGAV